SDNGDAQHSLGAQPRCDTRRSSDGQRHPFSAHCRGSQLHPSVEKSTQTSLGSGLIDPKCDSCCNADRGEEGVGASIVSGGDAAPVLGLCGLVLVLVALSVDVLVVGEGDLAASA